MLPLFIRHISCEGFCCNEMRIKPLALLVIGLIALTHCDTRSQWVRLSGPQSGVSLVSMDSNLFVCTGGGVYRTTDLGSTWLDASGGLSSGCNLGNVMVFGTHLFIITSQCKLWGSVDSGRSWQQQANGIAPSGNGGAGSITSFNDTLITCQGLSLYRSFDSGLTWISDSGIRWYPYGSHLPPVPAAVEQFAYSDNSLLAATDAGGIYRSVDAGASWKVVDSTGSFDTIVFCITTNGRFAFAGVENLQKSGGTLHRSTDFGLTWSVANHGLPNSKIRSLKCIGGTAFAGLINGGGVYASHDSGLSWFDVSLSLGGEDIRALEVCGSYLFAAGGSGLWRRPLSEMIGSAAVKPTDRIPVMRSTYPNPFSSSTTLSLSPATSGYAEVSIVNLLGTEVIHLFSGELPAGEHTFTWDARGMMPGMYMGVVRANGRTERIPMMLTR